MMKISKRLELLSNEINGYQTLADVGCDHGLFSIYSIKKHGIKHAFLLDINKEPLESAISNFNKHNIDNATFIQSDGLKEFNDKADCLVISGVGGHLATKILEDSIDKVKKFKKIIIQPNSDFDVLRKFLYMKKFTITYENIILDNKKYCYYLCAKFDNEVKYTKEDIVFGPVLRYNINDVYKKYWETKVNILEKQLNNIKQQNVKNEVVDNIDYIKKNIMEV